MRGFGVELIKVNICASPIFVAEPKTIEFILWDLVKWK